MIHSGSLKHKSVYRELRMDFEWEVEDLDGREKFWLLVSLVEYQCLDSILSRIYKSLHPLLDISSAINAL